MILKDEHGEIEVTGEMLVKLLKESWGIGCASGVQEVLESVRLCSDSRIIHYVNRVNQATWQSETWCTYFVKRYIFDFIRNGGWEHFEEGKA